MTKLAPNNPIDEAANCDKLLRDWEKLEEPNEIKTIQKMLNFHEELILFTMMERAFNPYDMDTEAVHCDNHEKTTSVSCELIQNACQTIGYSSPGNGFYEPLDDTVPASDPEMRMMILRFISIHMDRRHQVLTELDFVTEDHEKVQKAKELVMESLDKLKRWRTSL